MTNTIPEQAQRVLDGLVLNTGLALWEERRPLLERMRHYHTPGVSLAVVDGGEVVWAAGLGVCEAGQPRPVTTETLFQAASISKPTFALLVLRLAAEGVLDLDRDIADYLIGAAWQVPANDGWQPRLTLRHLLTHTAGLTVPGFEGYRVDEPRPTLPQILSGEAPANNPAVRCNLAPGFNIRYSGGGTSVGQYVVETVTGQPLEALMQAKVFGPLGMARSTFAQPLPAEWHAHAATAHGAHAEPVPGRWHVYPEQAAAGLWTTPSDLARMGLALQRALAGEAVDFVTPALAAEMFTPQFGEPNGLGWWLLSQGAGLRFMHNGVNEGFLSRMTMLVKGGQGMILMLNSGVKTADLLDEIEWSIAREFGWPPFAPEPQRRSAEADELAPCAGVYASAGLRPHRFEVAAADGQLLLSIDEQPPLEFYPVAEGGFATTQANARLMFEAGRLVLVQEGVSTTAERL